MEGERSPTNEEKDNSLEKENKLQISLNCSKLENFKRKKGTYWVYVYQRHINEIFYLNSLSLTCIVHNFHLSFYIINYSIINANMILDYYFKS